jgi:hypothetical protein
MTDPEVFIVRVWRQLAGAFRASARRVDEEEAHVFTAADQVVRFFEQGGRTNASATDGAATPTKEQP